MRITYTYTIGCEYILQTENLWKGQSRAISYHVRVCDGMYHCVVLEDVKKNEIGNQLIAKIERSDWHGFFRLGIQILKVGGALWPTIDIEEFLH